MTNKPFKAFLFLLPFLTLLNLVAVPSRAATDNNFLSHYKQEIIEYHLSTNNVKTIDDLINDVFPRNIGIDSEWYVIAFSQSDKYDFKIYENALIEYVNNKNISSHSSRLKFALALSSIGSTNDYIEETLNDSLGKQGIMSFVYGLHLINNGYNHNIYSSEDVINEILNKQLKEGGWAVRGEVSDVDVTSMVIQALAPYYDVPQVQTAINSALDCLSTKQLNDGDFLSYGVSNPESGAQLIVALSSLNIDFLNDNRFIKNGKTLLDGIIKYQLSDGSFSHVLNGETNSNATVQVFYTLVSYERFKKEKKGLYLLDSRFNDNVSENDKSDLSSEDNSTISNIEESKAGINSSLGSDLENEISKNNETNNEIRINFIIAIIIVILALLFACILKLNKKNLIVLLLCTILLLIFCFNLDIQTKDQYYNQEIPSKENPIGKVTMSIECGNIADKHSQYSYIPSDGIILDCEEFIISEGDTVYDILIEAAKKYSIHIENNGNNEMAYIAGINYIYEFDYGDLSGWMFLVNGKEASVGCTSYKLSDGDSIEWKYTLELGKDIN